MKTIIKILAVIFCYLLIAAHLFRANMPFLMLISLFIPFLLFWKTKISVRIIQISLLLSAFEWIRTMIFLINIRIETNENWIRMAIILGFVAILNLLSIFIFNTKDMKKIYHLK